MLFRSWLSSRSRSTAKTTDDTAFVETNNDPASLEIFGKLRGFAALFAVKLRFTVRRPTKFSAAMPPPRLERRHSRTNLKSRHRKSRAFPQIDGQSPVFLSQCWAKARDFFCPAFPWLKPGAIHEEAFGSYQLPRSSERGCETE